VAVSETFHHLPKVRAFWRHLIRPWLGRAPTPFYLFSATPVQAALQELDAAFAGLPVRHWLSCKTQPLAPLLRWWRDQGRDIEVVSEFEFRAALQEGFAPSRILVNGPAKHHWLPHCAKRGLSVNFDSVAEARALAPLARRLGWRCGLRLHTELEHDPEAWQYPTQFGMTREELALAKTALARHRVPIQTLHFHLRTNVNTAAVYERALQEAAATCRALGLQPRFVDCGGGFPPAQVLTRKGHPVDAEFRLADMADVVRRARAWFPSAEEFWMENGRWMSARSGVLVVQVRDVKERRGMRHLICDGGRTQHALISNWEAHELLSLPARGGPEVLTTVTGPTCMAFDQLARRPLPGSLRAGDHLIWLEAGAYHLPWETRFSHGLAAVLWHDGQKTTVARDRESFAEWWGQWRRAGLRPA
jgi:diaminopimelate decarboxylase